jgi:hypothetical protein
VYPRAMEDGADDPELVQLRALNARLEALHNARWDADGREDPTVVIAIEALDTEAAALIQARTDRTMVPLEAQIDAAIAEGHRLLGLPPPEPSPRAKALTEATQEAVAEHRRAGRKP